MHDISPDGIRLIESFEGFSATPYKDVAGVLTIGFGHTGPDVESLSPLTIEAGTALLRRDLATFVAAVNHLVRVPIDQNQMDALCSFVYNVGVANFSRSLSLRHLNAGDYAGCANDFRYWCHAGGKVLPGLVARRAAEASLFLRSEPAGRAAPARTRGRPHTFSLKGEVSQRFPGSFLVDMRGERR